MLDDVQVTCCAGVETGSWLVIQSCLWHSPSLSQSECGNALLRRLRRGGEQRTQVIQSLSLTHCRSHSNSQKLCSVSASRDFFPVLVFFLIEGSLKLFVQMSPFSWVPVSGPYNSLGTAAWKAFSVYWWRSDITFERVHTLSLRRFLQATTEFVL